MNRTLLLPWKELDPSERENALASARATAVVDAEDDLFFGGGSADATPRTYYEWIVCYHLRPSSSFLSWNEREDEEERLQWWYEELAAKCSSVDPRVAEYIRTWNDVKKNKSA